jgi:hypothetical protein
MAARGKIARAARKLIHRNYICVFPTFRLRRPEYGLPEVASLLEIVSHREVDLELFVTTVKVFF